MGTYSVEFMDKVDELARLAAGEGLSVNVLVRPVLCPMDDKTAAFAALMGAFVGQSSYVGMTAPTAVAGDGDSETFEESLKKYREGQGGDCRCFGGVCACHGSGAEA